jgi:hypothetical protein
MTAKSAKLVPTANGRTATGKFAKGNPGGPGNPHANAVRRFRTELLRAVTVDEVSQLARTYFEKGLVGDIDAARLIWPYYFGKPGAEEDDAVAAKTVDDCSEAELVGFIEHAEQLLVDMRARLAKLRGE